MLVFIYNPVPFSRLNKEKGSSVLLVSLITEVKPNKKLEFSYLNINEIDPKCKTDEFTSFYKYSIYIIFYFIMQTTAHKLAVIVGFLRRCV